MTTLCRLCTTNGVVRNGSVVCVTCGRQAGEYVLTAPHSDIAIFWKVDEQIVERRSAALLLVEKRARVDGAAEIGAGLAVGYLETGLLVHALVAAAVSLRFGPTSPEFCWCAVDVLFDDRLFRWESAGALHRVLSAPPPAS